MSPVCKKCRNYVMDFPCPHCGSELEFTDRSVDEIKPIIPLDLQESFEEPPPPLKSSLDRTSTLPYQPSIPSQPRPHIVPSQTHTPPRPVSSSPSFQQVPSTPPTKQPQFSVPPPIEKTPQTPPPPPPSITVDKTVQVPPPIPPRPSVTISKEVSEAIIPIDDINKHFKELDSHLKKLESRQKHYESQAKKYESTFKEIDKKLQKIEKSLNILLKTNQKLESIHKSTSKDLKKAL